MSLREARHFVLKEAKIPDIRSTEKIWMTSSVLYISWTCCSMRKICRNPGWRDRQCTGSSAAGSISFRNPKHQLLFKEMQSQKIHVGLLIDEFGQTAGIRSPWEDILEKRSWAHSWIDMMWMSSILSGERDALIRSGMTPLDEAKEKSWHSFPEEDLENYDTINGLLISRLDRIPGVMNSRKSSILVTVSAY